MAGSENADPCMLETRARAKSKRSAVNKKTAHKNTEQSNTYMVNLTL
jgi:hypothetical protein